LACPRCLCGKSEGATVALLLWMCEEFDKFDLWCMKQGIEFHSLTSRRLVHLIYDHLTEGLDAEGIQNFDYKIEAVGKTILNPPAPDEPKPPEWWMPEEQNWANIQSFLGQASVIEKAVSQQVAMQEEDSML